MWAGLVNWQTLLYGEQVEPGHGSGDSKMPACGGSKFGESHILTALILPREFIQFF